jgi:hypothetical protein
MGKKEIQRAFRTRNLTVEEAAKDDTIRRQVEAEFPPAPATGHAAPEQDVPDLATAPRRSDAPDAKEH